MSRVDGIPECEVDGRRYRRLGDGAPATRHAAGLGFRLQVRLLALATLWPFVALVGPTTWAAAATCSAGSGVYLQVLGSGGPIADDGRASSAYILWQAGKSRILVDAGGGAFVRFGEAGARFEDLDHVAISHFHTDHSADFVTLLKSGYFSARKRPLAVSGPGPGGPFPGLDRFLASMIGPGGAYAYLSGYLDGTGGLVRLLPEQVDAGSRETQRIAGGDDLEISATGVPHGIVPTLAYRVRLGDRVVVFASDQNGSDDSFSAFARHADVLVMHMVIPEDADVAGRSLHAPPSRIGEIAAASEARTLVLSHFMARSLRDLEHNVALVRAGYEGRIVVAEDLLCIPVGE